MRDISVKARLIIISTLAVVGVFGPCMSGKLGYILAFIGLFGLVIMVTYMVIKVRRRLAEIRRRKFQTNQL